ncbi:GNAT family N-acetyltransferase [Marinibactrum halimedae]|uniref:N-acetyltransferase n=1 Tax=Marinibactrum halimedae TaxID=1444977 RepID=A0AA37T3V3_9GAMM|nr:GNAT family N-acetyltransferase [Marinibactrum halimedae]MCD9458785.1 GNAT family N-acetyltransferase [Marinibactrum halimedae]GLS25344.1 N-acetyltransferase [Marinibactrum halimedae]
MIIRSITSDETLPLRQAVLWPQKSLAFCRVENDHIGKHFGVFSDTQNELISVASIYIEGKSARLRKFATATKYQGQGIGTKMIQFILQTLSDDKIDLFWCDARESAVGFYQRFGMKISGDKFFKHNVAYYKVEIKLNKQEKV